MKIKLPCECTRCGKGIYVGECISMNGDGKFWHSEHNEDTGFEVYQVCYDGSLRNMGTDNINHPSHYTSHPSGIECIQIIEHFDFCIGSAIKYLWRAGLKGDKIEDLKKAAWLINREIERLTKNK